MTSENFEFPHEYELQSAIDFPPGGGKIHYFPDDHSGINRDGTLIEVKPNGRKPWIGMFAFGTAPLIGFSGVLSCPDRNHFCVVSKGNGFVVNANAPGEFIVIPNEPVLDVRVVFSHGLILFSSFTSVVAIGLSGIAWVVDDVVTDELKILGIKDEYVICTGWNAPENLDVEVKINLRDGSVISL